MEAPALHSCGFVVGKLEIGVDLENLGVNLLDRAAQDFNMFRGDLDVPLEGLNAVSRNEVSRSVTSVRDSAAKSTQKDVERATELNCKRRRAGVCK